MGFSKATLGLGHISWWLTGDFMGLNTVMLQWANYDMIWACLKIEDVPKIGNFTV